jgi:xylulokinase
VLEGVACAARALLDRLEGAAGLAVEAIRLSGGGSRSDLWCQLKADVMDRPLMRLTNSDTGTFGAAILAGVGDKVYPSIGAANETAVRVEREFLPRPAQRARCDFVFARYLECYRAMKPTSQALHDFAHRSP